MGLPSSPYPQPQPQPQPRPHQHAHSPLPPHPSNAILGGRTPSSTDKALPSLPPVPTDLTANGIQNIIPSKPPATTFTSHSPFISTGSTGSTARPALSRTVSIANTFGQRSQKSQKSQKSHVHGTRPGTITPGSVKSGDSARDNDAREVSGMGADTGTGTRTNGITSASVDATSPTSPNPSFASGSGSGSGSGSVSVSGNAYGESLHRIHDGGQDPSVRSSATMSGEFDMVSLPLALPVPSPLPTSSTRTFSGTATRTGTGTGTGILELELDWVRRLVWDMALQGWTGRWVLVRVLVAVGVRVPVLLHLLPDSVWTVWNGRRISCGACTVVM